MPVRSFALVTPDGPGEHVGTFDLVEGRMVATSGVAEQTLAMLRRRHHVDDPALFERLTTAGWSNGQIMVTT